MLSSKTIAFIVGAFAANGTELNEAGIAVIEAALGDKDDEQVRQATIAALKSGQKMTLAAINKELEAITTPQLPSPSALADRAIKLLRHPQRGGHEKAQAEDPEAYALLQKVGRWFDVHTRSEHDLKGLRFDLKEAARDAIRSSKEGQQALSSGQDSSLYLTH
jgi:hypothetical protein